MHYKEDDLVGPTLEIQELNFSGSVSTWLLMVLFQFCLFLDEIWQKNVGQDSEVLLKLHLYPSAVNELKKVNEHVLLFPHEPAESCLS